MHSTRAVSWKGYPDNQAQQDRQLILECSRNCPSMLLQLEMLRLLNILKPTFLWSNRFSFVGRANQNVKSLKQMRMPSFDAFNFSPAIRSYIEQKKFHTPSSIQEKAYNQLLKPTQHNYYLISPTGSGKTLAYLLPIFNILKQQEENSSTKLTKPNRPRCVIVVSSKELVMQVTEVCKGISHFCKLKVYGLDKRRSEKQEIEKLNSGVDVLVITLDRLNKMRDHIFLSYVSFLVIDELDTLLDAACADSLQVLIEAVKIRQLKATDQRIFAPKILLVSATFTKLIDGFFKNCFKTYQRDERFYTNEEWNSVVNKPSPKQQFQLKKIIGNNCHLNLQNIRHEFIHCKSLDKHQPLYSLFMQHKKGSKLIFCNTIKSLHEVEYYLNQMKIETTSLHGDLNHNMRKANFDKFNGKAVSIMLTTDLGSRGLDFPFLEHVINYDFPMSISDYLHRAGRTGRAGKPGTVYTLYHQKNIDIINQLRASHDSNKPLDIKRSAYSLSNKEDLQQKYHNGETRQIYTRKDNRRKTTDKKSKALKIKPAYAQKVRRSIKRKQGRRKQ